MQLRCQYNVGAGRELQALLPKGFRFEHTDMERGLNQEQWVTVWYEKWVQFPTEQWEALQDEIMVLLRRNPDLGRGPGDDE